MSSIQNLIFQVWNDLRARRLVPVAVLLVAGLVAAPVVLSKGSDEPAAETVAPATGNAEANRPAGPDELAKVKLDEGLEPGSGSSLSAFDADDPFLPPEKVLAKAREAGDDGATSDGAQTGTNAPDTGGTSTDTGGGTTTGGGDTSGGDTTGGDNTGDGNQKATQYQYVLDVTFWANGRRRKIEGLRKLDILPNEASPLLIFMGVTERAGNGVFLVDSTLETTGEGKLQAEPRRLRLPLPGTGLRAGVHQRGRRLLPAAHRRDPQGQGRCEPGWRRRRVGRQEQRRGDRRRGARALLGVPRAGRRDRGIRSARGRLKQRRDGPIKGICRCAA